MSRRTIMSIAASIIIGIGCIAMISTDAFARGGRAAGVGRAGVGVHHVGVAPVRRGVAVGVGAAAVGAAAVGSYARCGYYPYPACY
jgi:hypothetical protein